MNVFRGLVGQREGLQTWAERNAAKSLEKKQSQSLFCTVFWVRMSLSSEGTGLTPGDTATTPTQGITILRERNLAPWHCSSSLLLLEAKLALGTNPLNNFQLLSKSIGSLNHESPSWCTTPLRFQLPDLFVQKLFICSTNRNNVKLTTGEKKISCTSCLTSKGISLPEQIFPLPANHHSPKYKFYFPNLSNFLSHFTGMCSCVQDCVLTPA